MNRQQLIQELTRDEGTVLHAYEDHLGYVTIGIGRLIDKRKGGGISLHEAQYLLGNDVDRVYVQLSAALPWFKRLSDGRQRALCNMAFQLGINGLLAFRNTLGLMEQGKWKEASSEALKSKWATQTPARAKRVAELIEKG